MARFPRWMKFMEAEFDRLDKDGKGKLNRRELLESRVFVKRAPAKLGK